VQRIPRYRLLLVELLKQYRRVGDSGLPAEVVARAVSEMEEAVEKMTEVASHVNESIREQERTEQLFALQEELRGLGGRTSHGR
jgi:hypothetical protein